MHLLHNPRPHPRDLEAIRSGEGALEATCSLEGHRAASREVGPFEPLPSASPPSPSCLVVGTCPDKVGHRREFVFVRTLSPGASSQQVLVEWLWIHSRNTQVRFLPSTRPGQAVPLCTPASVCTGACVVWRCVCVRVHTCLHTCVGGGQGPAFLGVSSHGWLLSSQTSPDTFQESVRTGSWLTGCKGGLPWVRLGQTASLRLSPGAATPSGPEQGRSTLGT